MSSIQQHSSIGLVLDGPQGQRLAERLARFGAHAHAVSSAALASEPQLGQLYIAPVSLATSAAAATQQGAHVCLVPPWPLDTLRIGSASIGVAELERRGSVRYATALAESAMPAGAKSGVLKILCRERLVGALGTVLATTEAGEPVLGALPRASNRHGYLLVTSLQLITASAQTHLEDVAHLVHHISAWCSTHADPPVLHRDESNLSVESADTGEEYAPIIVLAIAQAHSLQPESAASGDLLSSHISMPRDAVRADFEWVCRTIGLTVEPDAFDNGWAWLEAHGAISSVAGGTSRQEFDVGAITHFVTLWQLSPRLRRLRRIDRR